MWDHCISIEIIHRYKNQRLKARQGSVLVLKKFMG
jgi:hypothetical protein